MPLIFSPAQSVVDDQTANADWYMKDAKADAIKGRLGGRGDGEFAIRNRSVGVYCRTP